MVLVILEKHCSGLLKSINISYVYKQEHDLTGHTQLAFVEDVQFETLDGTTIGPMRPAFMQIEGSLKASYLIKNRMTLHRRY